MEEIDALGCCGGAKSGSSCACCVSELFLVHEQAHHTELSNFALLRRPPSTMLSKLMSALAS